MKQLHLLIAVAITTATPAFAATLQVSGAITNNTIWFATNVYQVVDDVTVAYGARLTIQAGTVVKFFKRKVSDSYQLTSVHLYVQGALRAQGTSGNKIYFTSIDDPSVGGSEGGDSLPETTDWGWIEFQDQSDNAQCLLEYCVFRYGGNNYYNACGSTSCPRYTKLYAVRCIGALPAIRNCELYDSQGGIYVSGQGIGIEGCTFSRIQTHGIIVAATGSGAIFRDIGVTRLSADGRS